MNKKILSIFALIMALSFAVSCSNSDTTGTGGNNGGGNPTAVTKDTIATAVKGALGATLKVKEDGATMKTDNTVVTLETGSITITITDESLNTGSDDATKTTAVASLNALKAEVKTALVAQGLVIEGDITFAEASNSNPSYTINATATSIKPNTDTTKYTLPTELKDQDAITIKVVLTLGSSGVWA